MRIALSGLLALGLGCGSSSQDAAPGPCAEARTCFRDATAAAGLTEVGPSYVAGLTDVDGDGVLDVVTAGSGGLRLFLGGGDGTFAEREDAGLSLGVRGEAVGLGCADYDADGDLDLAASWGSRLVLFANEGGGRFIDATAESRIEALVEQRYFDGPPRGTAWATTWGDADGDGVLDLWLGVMGEMRIGEPEGLPARFLRGLGDGTFEDATDASGLGHAGQVHATALADLTGDGHADGLVASDFDHAHFYRNEGAGAPGRFVDASEAAFVTDPGEPMGFALGDPDADGDLDFFVTNSGGGRLYMNEGEGTFVESAGVAGLAAATERSVGWGTALRDLDLDGHEDFVQVNGDASQDEPQQRLRYPDELTTLRFGIGDGSFVADAAAHQSLGQRQLVSRALAVADYDADGDLDLLVGNVGPRSEVVSPQLHQNLLEARPRVIVVVPRGPAGNREGVGAVVRLHTSQRVRAAHIGQDGHTCVPHEAWFALRAGEQPERVEISWPGGTTSSQDLEAAATGRIAVGEQH